MSRAGYMLGAGLALALSPGSCGSALAATPAPVLAAVRAAAAHERLPLVALRSSPSLRVVVRLDDPAAQLRRGSVSALLRAVAPLRHASWDVIAIDGRGMRIREERRFRNGGEAYIRPDLDGCDPSFVVIGRAVTSMFSSDPLCAGDAPAPAGHPADVGGAQPGVAFPLTVAARGRRLYARVNGALYRSRPELRLAMTVGSAMLTSTSQLEFSVAGATITLRRTS